MGTSRSPAELSRKLSQLAVEMQDLPLAMVKEASQATKAAVKGRAPARLSGRGKRGAKLDVRYNVGNYGGEAKSLVFATGPFHLIERDTKPHRIPALKGQKTRQNRAVRATKGRTFGPAFGGVKTGGKPIVFGDKVRNQVWHPGTKGQHPWEHGVTAAQSVIRKVFESKGELVLRRVF